MLTEQERGRFSAYLRDQINSHAAFIEQTQKVGIPFELEKKYKTEMLGMRVVLDMITSGETQTIK